MLIQGKAPQYCAYLLRCWSEQSQEQLGTWRFSLEDVTTGQRHGFADLPALLAFLEGRLQGEEEPCAA